MKRFFVDKQYSFYEVFDDETGFYMRSGEIVDGIDTGVDPFLRSFPSLIDVGVMGHCEHGISGLCTQSGVQCYQSGFTKKQENMTLDNFKRIVDESKGKVFQIALGGRGDVDCHEDFEAILAYCCDNNIVPNFTTSGLLLTPEKVEIIKKYCGAVAVSWYRQEHTIRAINMLIEAGIKTNIHYVLGNFSVDEAILQLKYFSEDNAYPESCSFTPFPKGINAVIFLAHKPVGQGGDNDVLQPNDTRIKEFFKLIDKGNTPFKIGFDSCSICGVINYCTEINMDSCDYCEGARYSMYITPDMKALPCSFDQEYRWAIQMDTNCGIKDSWDSEKFNHFRSFFKHSCPECKEKDICGGGCPIVPCISLCDKDEKAQVW